MRVACRRVGIAGDVRLAGAPGWVDLAQANVRDRASIERALEGADAVVNLVGILAEKGKQTFESTQRDGAALIAEVAAEKGITRFVQVSAIGADPESPSDYGKTKAEAEVAVREKVPAATILRPSIVFGPEDGFFNKFAGMATWPIMNFLPMMPLIGGGATRFQPVYAGDVAAAIATAVDDPSAAGRTYELGGPRTYSFSELYDIVFANTDRKRFKIPLPFFIAKPVGYMMGAIWRYIPPFSWGFMGEVPVTGDQVEMLKADNVAADGMPGLKDLGVTQPETVEAIVPSYLWRFRPYGQFSRPTGSEA
ncbi:MAG: complex I NDUFA9 subunit family protein [Hyphomonas sp.]